MIFCSKQISAFGFGRWWITLHEKPLMFLVSTPYLGTLTLINALINMQPQEIKTQIRLEWLRSW